MKKYSDMEAAVAPQVFYALPELHYPPRLNAVRTLLEDAERNGWDARPAYFHDGAAVSYGTVRHEVARYAGALERLGARAGDRVLLRIEDGPELVYAALAVQALGAIAVPTYVQLRAEGLLYRARDCGAKFTLVSARLLDEIAAVADDSAALLGTIAVLPRDPSGRLASFDDVLPAEPRPIAYADTDGDDVALILYTSGSTGLPKGACHSHTDLLAVCDSYCRYCVDLKESDVIAGPPAIPFALGFGFFILFPLRFGAAAILEADKAPETLIARCVEHRATIVVGVATYFNRLGRVLAERRERPTGLRMALCGGEPLPEEVERFWGEATGVPLEQFLGTTELLHDIIAIRHGLDRPKAGAIGKPVPGYEISVRDPHTFLPLGPGQPGLLCARGPTGTRYLNRPEAQAATVREGWNVFQDIVHFDEEGYIHYVARHDDMIITGGHSISPVEVEQVLMKHPAVAECACTAAPDPTGARPHVVKAFVVVRPGLAAGSDLKADIQHFFKGAAPPYMYPREIEFLERLPRTMNGKIMRSELRKAS